MNRVPCNFSGTSRDENRTASTRSRKRERPQFGFVFSMLFLRFAPGRRSRHIKYQCTGRRGSYEGLVHRTLKLVRSSQQQSDPHDDVIAMPGTQRRLSLVIWHAKERSPQSATCDCIRGTRRDSRRAGILSPRSPFMANLTITELPSTWFLSGQG